MISTVEESLHYNSYSRGILDKLKEVFWDKDLAQTAVKVHLDIKNWSLKLFPYPSG